jgi:hypothetical protein
MTTYPDRRRCLFGLGRAELGLLPPPCPPSSHCRSSAPLRPVADERGLLQEGVWRRATPHPKCRRRLFAFGPGPPGCAGAAAPQPPPFFRCCRPAPLRVVADEHCPPQEGECLCSTTHPVIVTAVAVSSPGYPDCRRCLFGLGRAELGPLPCRLRRAHTAAALLRCGRSPMSVACSRKGCGAVRPRSLNAVIFSSPSGRARRAELGPLPRSLRHSSAAAAPLRCGWSPMSTDCLPQEGVCFHSMYLQPLLGPVSDVLCDVVQPALAGLVKFPADSESESEMCGVLRVQRYAPTRKDCSRCSNNQSNSSARGAAGQAGRAMIGGLAKPPGVMAREPEYCQWSET